MAAMTKTCLGGSRGRKIVLLPPPYAELLWFNARLIESIEKYGEIYVCLSPYFIARDVLNDAISYQKENCNKGDKGIIHYMLERKLEPNLIERIIVDFILAAGDTVHIYRKLYLIYYLYIV